MDKPEKRKNVNSSSNKLNCQKINNSFLHVYINNFVKKFRNFNHDEFLISISGIKMFVNKNNKILECLFEQLKENNFIIELEGNEESINKIDITCKNITKDSSYNFEYQIQSLPSIIELSSKTDTPIAGILIMKIVAQIISKLKILYKAIVLDLDDTLWKGTLSEDGIDKIKENMYSEQGDQFIAFMKFVKTLSTELGVFIAISSKNDSKMVETAIKKLDDNIFPLINQVDYIIANNNDKSENIRKIAEQLSILPNSVVFIDDNQIVRDEVKHQLPEVFVPEWTNHDDLVTQLITGCIFERVELSLNSQNRRKQFKTIQTVRSQNNLPVLSVKVINDDKHIESIRLYSKSNQFKFSQNNDKFGDDAKSLYFEIYRENGDNLGICSAITYTNSNNTLLVYNWAMSCRYFGIGLEEFILIYLRKIANTDKIFITYNKTEYNLKVSELLDKYSKAFKYNDKRNVIEIIFKKEFLDNITNKTNLELINE